MSQLADLYQVLGVPEDADAAAIKQAFRQKAKQWHPDANPGDAKAEERFKELNQAHEILSDPEKRRRYDAMRRSPYQGAEQGPVGQGGAWAGGSIDDLFEMFFGGGGGGAGGGFGGFGGFNRAPAAGRDLESEVAVSFEDAALGRSITINLQGQEQPLKLNLPAGAESGLRLRLAGQGAPGRGGRRGDLYLTLKVRPSGRFRREGLDIIATAPLNLAQALLGCSLEVETLHGRLRVKVPAGSQSGTHLRLRGKGIQTAEGHGDHLVELAVPLPKDLDEAERRSIQAMAEKRGWEL